jgi:hypothetical protein
MHDTPCPCPHALTSLPCYPGDCDASLLNNNINNNNNSNSNLILYTGHLLWLQAKVAV